MTEKQSLQAYRPHLHSDWIDSHAYEIVGRLQKAGFKSYLVGGCVRDLLAGIHPKDYDIATSAHPEAIKRLIRGSYIIGRRFRLVLVKRGPHQFEVATFRRNALPEETAEQMDSSEQPVSPDNYFGTPEEDAIRRDFTVNALFYDPLQNSLLDYIDGRKDVADGVIKMIGDPDLRLKEDPIRILRAIRLTHKLKFTLDTSLRSSMERNAEELQRAILPRKREEYLKIMRLDDPGAVFQELFDLGLLHHWLPALIPHFKNESSRNILLSYLSRTTEIVYDPSDPVQLFLPFWMAFHEIYATPALADETLTTNGEPVSIGEHEPALEFLDAFLKDEIGAFKGEFGALLQGQNLTGTICRTDSFKKRGSRRQSGFLETESLPLAYQMCRTNYLLSPEQDLFWITLINKKRQNRENSREHN